MDLGQVGSTVTDPVVWAAGILRDPVLQVTTTGELEKRSACWRSMYNDPVDAVRGL